MKGTLTHQTIGGCLNRCFSNVYNIYISIITRRLTFLCYSLCKSVNVKLDLELDKGLSTMHLFYIMLTVNV
jgi:hypothetical protein